MPTSRSSPRTPIEFRDEADAGQIGWREVTAAGISMTLDRSKTSLPRGRAAGLTWFRGLPLSTPPDETQHVDRRRYKAAVDSVERPI